MENDAALGSTVEIEATSIFDLVCPQCNEKVFSVVSLDELRRHFRHVALLDQVDLYVFTMKILLEPSESGAEGALTALELKSEFHDYLLSSARAIVEDGQFVWREAVRYLNAPGLTLFEKLTDEDPDSAATAVSQLQQFAERALALSGSLRLDAGDGRVALKFAVDERYSKHPQIIFDAHMLALAIFMLKSILGTQKSVRVCIVLEKRSPATGHLESSELAALETSFDALRELDLEYVEPGACVAYLNSAASSQVTLTSGENTPPPHPYGVSDRGAEFLVRDWMRFMGIQDAEVTQYTGDGGIDVLSATHIAQVKNYRGAIGIESLRALRGVSVSDGKVPLFFTSGRFPSSAHRFAEEVGIGLFIYDAEAGTCTSESSVARSLARASA